MDNWRVPMATGVQPVKILSPTAKMDWSFGTDKIINPEVVNKTPTYAGPLNTNGLDNPAAAGTGFNLSGKWTEGASAVSSLVNAGVGVYSAMQQAKMNDFMRSYYKDQMALQRTDFGNAARSANQALDAQSRRVASAQGLDKDEYAAAQMDQWGAKETY